MTDEVSSPQLIPSRCNAHDEMNRRLARVEAVTDNTDRNVSEMRAEVKEALQSISNAKAEAARLGGGVSSAGKVLAIVVAGLVLLATSVASFASVAKLFLDSN